MKKIIICGLTAVILFLATFQSVEAIPFYLTFKNELGEEQSRMNGEPVNGVPSDWVLGCAFGWNPNQTNILKDYDGFKSNTVLSFRWYQRTDFTNKTSCLNPDNGNKSITGTKGDIFYVSYTVKNNRTDTDFTTKVSLYNGEFSSGSSKIIVHPQETIHYEQYFTINYSSVEGYRFYVYIDTLNYEDTFIATIGDIRLINVSDTFGQGNEPPIEELKSEYLDKMPYFFDTFEWIKTNVNVANQGDLEVGIVEKDNFMKDFSHLYLGYKLEYDNLSITATEDEVINDCKADFLFMGTYFDLNANKDNCNLDPENTNYRVALDLLQDGVVKSDLENDSYFRIQYTNVDYEFRTTQIAINFNEEIKGVRTVVVGMGDNTQINDFDKVKFIFKYQDYIVGYQEEPVTNLLESNVLVLTIYNTIMTYDSFEIYFQQQLIESDYNVDFSLTELAFLKDTVVTTPIGQNNLRDASGDVLKFQIEYGSCGTWDLGCHLKNAALWLVIDSPMADQLWEEYGVLFEETYNITRTQQDIVETLNSDTAEKGLIGIIGLISAALGFMVYSAISRLFK